MEIVFQSTIKTEHDLISRIAELESNRQKKSTMVYTQTLFLFRNLCQLGLVE